MGIRSALRLVDAAGSISASTPQVRPGWAARSHVSTLPDGSVPVLVSRDTAMSVPTFSQGVQVIAGTVGTFPLSVRRDRTPLPLPGFLQQPDPDEPASITWTRLCQDLVLYPYAWLYVTDRLADGFPRTGMYLPSEYVQVHPLAWNGPDVLDRDGRVMLAAGAALDPTRVIRFDSPTAPGALQMGVRIITTALLVEEAVRRFARLDIPAGYLHQTGGPELTADEIGDLLDAWEGARVNRSTAFLSQTVDYTTTTLDPRALQLVEARNANAVDIARLLNLPPTFVNAETGGSLTYSTVAQQAQALASTTLLPYLTAIGGRLSMGDVTPHGTVVEHDLSAFLRTDLQSRAQAYQTLLASGVLTVAEVRRWENLPDLSAPEGMTP